MPTLAPGSRAVIRDEEWLISRVDPATDGGYLLTCDGISDLVRGRSALFLTSLEDKIEVLDPANTQLEFDESSAFNATFLYLESLHRRSVPNDDAIHLGHRGVMNLVPYQLDPALQALRQTRPRILIADAVGLGKTLEAGILATELIQRGRGKRILVVTQKAMLTQFQKEWWSRFSIPLVRLDSVGLARVRNRIPANHNPFNYFDRSIISIDTLKSNLEYRNYLENAWWDIIVIDECHNVAARAGDTGLSRRARLAKLLANRSDTLMLLSATPHDGSARSFASLMSLLDPTAISDPDDYTPEDFRNKGLVTRKGAEDFTLEPFDAFVQRAGLKAGSLPNSGLHDGLKNMWPILQKALPDAVETMRQFMVAQQAAFAAHLQTRLQTTLGDLQQLQTRQMQQLELQLAKGLDTVIQSRRARRSQEIGRVFDDYRKWVEDTLTTEPQPWIQVLAAVCNPNTTQHGA